MTEKDRSTTYHWGSDPYWTDALQRFRNLREQGVRELRLDLEAIESVIFEGTSVAYRSVDAMHGVMEHEGLDGRRGAPRLLLATSALLREAPSARRSGS